MLIDTVLAERIASSVNYDPARLARIRTVARHASRFNFSEQASALIGRFAAECTDLLLENWQFAKPPYEHCYIEFSSLHFFHGQTRTSNGEAVQNDHESIDRRLGYLIDGLNVYVFAAYHKPPDLLCPIYWTWGELGQAVSGTNIMVFKAPNEEVDGGQDNFHARLALGKAGSVATEAQMKLLGPSIRFGTLLDFGFWADISNERKLDLVKNQGGDLRNVVACLLWLNQPAHIRYIDVPASGRLVKGKRVASPRHRTVEIDLANRTKTIRRAFMALGPRNSPGRHKVRGEWHHRHGDKAHSHTWPALPNEKGHFKCPGCGRLRYWVKEHRRGVSKEGYIEHDYAITVGDN